MAAKEYPVGTFAATEAVPNPELENKSLEELSELIKWPSKMAAFAAEQEAAPEPSPEPEPVEQAPVEPPTPEPVTEVAAPAAEPEPTPAELSQEDIDRELLKAQIEAMEAHSKKLEAKLTGREAGERGYIKQLQDRIRRLESGGMEPSAETPPEPEYTPAEMPPQKTDGFRTWAVQKATGEAIQEFMDSHPEMIKEFEPDAARYLQDRGFDARTIYNLDDPIAAGREMTRVLDETYWHVRESRTRARVAELQTRKADQVRGLEEAKRRAAPSASGSPPAPPPPRRTTKDLSLAELESQVKALRGPGGR